MRPTVAIRARRDAAALGRIGDARSRAPLLAALADAEVVRASAAAALAYFSDRRAPKALLSSLRDPAPSVRAAAASALWCARDPAIRAALQTAMQDPDVFVRQSAACALKNPGRGSHVRDYVVIPPRRGGWGLRVLG